MILANLKERIIGKLQKHDRLMCLSMVSSIPPPEEYMGFCSYFGTPWVGHGRAFFKLLLLYI